MAEEAEDFSGIGSPPEPGEDEKPTGLEESSDSEKAAEDGEDQEAQEYQNALDQCGGSKEELGKRFFKNQNDSANLARDRNTLQETLAKRPAEKEPDPEPTPDLLRNTRRIEALESGLKELDADRSAVLSRIADARGDIRYIEGQIERADDLDRPDLTAKLTEAKRSAASAQKEWRSFGSKERELKDQVDERKDERKGIESKIQGERARQVKADEDQEEFEKGFPAFVDGLISASADELKVPKIEKVRQGLWKSVNARVAMDLQHMRETGVTNVDMQALVKGHVKEFAEIHDLADREAFDAESRRKRSVQRPGSRSGTPPTNTDAEPQRPRWQDVEERAPSMQRAREGMETKFTQHLEKHGHI